MYVRPCWCLLLHLLGSAEAPWLTSSGCHELLHSQQQLHVWCTTTSTQ
jgi:hypothetical protein